MRGVMFVRVFENDTVKFLAVLLFIFLFTLFESDFPSAVNKTLIVTYVLCAFFVSLRIFSGSWIKSFSDALPQYAAAFYCFIFLVYGLYRVGFTKEMLILLLPYSMSAILTVFIWLYLKILIKS